MFTRCGWAARGGLACLLCFPALAAAEAKPPDLPLPQEFLCPELREGPGRGELFETERRANPEADVDEPVRVEQARAMFAIGERCRRLGDLDKARTCYEETHLLSPTSRYGRLAMQRLAEIDEGRGTTEEEQGPRPGKRRRRALEAPPVLKPLGSQPLGLVERAY
jgi:hypothetical protein